MDKYQFPDVHGEVGSADGSEQEQNIRSSEGEIGFYTELGSLTKQLFQFESMDLAKDLDQQYLNRLILDVEEPGHHLDQNRYWEPISPIHKIVDLVHFVHLIKPQVITETLLIY